MICHVFEQCLVRLVVLAQLGLYVRHQQGVVTRRRRLDRVFEGCGHRRRRRRLSSRRHDDGRGLGRYRLGHGSRHFSNRLHDGRRLGRHRRHHGRRHFSNRLNDGLGSSRLFSNRHWRRLWRYRLGSNGLRLDRHRLGDCYRLFSGDGRRLSGDGLDDRLSDGRRLNSSHNRLGLSSNGRRLDRCRLFSDRLDDRLDNCLNDGRRLFRNRLDDRLGNRLRRDINSSTRGSISSLGGHDNFRRGLDGSRLFSRYRLNGSRLYSRRLSSRRFSSRRLYSRRLGGRRFGGRIDRSCFVSHVVSFG